MKRVVPCPRCGKPHEVVVTAEDRAANPRAAQMRNLLRAKAAIACEKAR